MLNGIFAIAASRFRQQVPEFQIYLRNRYGVRSFTLSAARQMVFYAVAMSAVLWSGFATVNYFLHFRSLHARAAQYEALHDAYAGVSEEKAAMERRLAALSSELEISRAQLAAQAVTNDPPAEKAALPREDPRKEVSDIQPRPKPQGREARVRGTGSGESAIALAPQPMRKPRQVALPGHAAADSGTAVQALERLIRQTGLDADAILRRRTTSQSPNAENGASGGPLLTLPPRMTQKFMRRNAPGEVYAPSGGVGRLEMLREALFSLPLAEPVDKYYISSGFGYRKDPFTQGRAFHSGADLVAAHGDPVRASAPGVIIFAARNGPYGNMVEIDHGNGVRSRYGHLSRIAVAKGQKIGLRDLIGYVGNTGRSGAAHLHFEVWFDGKARNPLNFLKAGENVFQRQG